MQSKHKTMSKKYTVNKTEIKAVQTLLKMIGQDTEREGLKDTPKRYVKFLKEFCNPEPFNMTTFENEGSTNEMIIVSNIPFFSLCLYPRIRANYLEGYQLLLLSFLRTFALHLTPLPAATTIGAIDF